MIYPDMCKVDDLSVFENSLGLQSHFIQFDWSEI